MLIDKFNVKDDILRISATNLNKMVDSLNANGVGRGEYGKCYIQNKTGADISEPYSILGIGDNEVFNPETNKRQFLNYPTFEGVTPGGIEHATKFVITREPVKNNAISEAATCGVVPVQINITDEDHEYAGVTDGVTAYLTSFEAGVCEILWKDSGIGIKWAIVRLNARSDDYAYKTTADPSGGTVTAKIIDNTGAVVGSNVTGIVLE